MLRAVVPSGVLAAEVVSVARLSVERREAMWRVFHRYYADVTRTKFDADLAVKNDVILLLDSGDRSVRGFSTIELSDRREGGRRLKTVFSGDTVIDEPYWGQSALHRAFVRYVVGLKLRNPLTPVYWFLISKGYKTYLLLARNFTCYYPRHDRPTPAAEERLLASLASAKYGAAFCAEQGVLRFAGAEGRLKHGVAPLDEGLLANPDVRFFADRNPGHRRGDELCCLGRVDAGLWLKFSLRLVIKALKRTQQSGRRLLAAIATRVAAVVS